MVEVPRSASDEASRPLSAMSIRTTRGTEPAPAQAVSRLAARGSHLDHRGEGSERRVMEALHHRGKPVYRVLSVSGDLLLFQRAVGVEQHTGGDLEAFDAAE